MTQKLTHADRSAVTALDHWLPAVEAAGVPFPQTVVIESSRVDMSIVCSWYDSFCLETDHETRLEQWKRVVAETRQVASEIGLPCFIRTAHTSGKHDWERTCYNDDLDKIGHRLSMLVEDTLLKDLSLGFFVVREFLPLKAFFHAFWGKMPVAREFRFFAEPGKVYHVQPYWPPYTIKRPSIEDWEEKLAELSRLDDATREELSTMALRVVEKLGHRWSVDFAQHEDGRWFLIDMAHADISFVWPGEWDGERFRGSSS